MHKRFEILCAAALAAASIAVSAQGVVAGALQIGQPWARSTVPAQKTGGAYLQVRNTGSTPDRLLGGTTSAAERVELHSMKMEGDVMKMREVPAIEVPAGQTVALQPGGLHLMLVGLKGPLKPGAAVPLTLKFEKAGQVKVDLKVESDAPQPRPATSGHQHQH